MIGLLLLMVALLAAPFAAGQSAGTISPGRSYGEWTVFLHEGSGYELPVPPGVRALGDPRAATQPNFASLDGSFRMSAWGGLSRQPPRPHFEAEWKLALSKPGRSINYQRRATTWFVVSGTYANGMEFYEKFMMRGNHVGGFVLHYPRLRLREFDPWVVGIERGFRLVGTPRADAGVRAESAPREAPQPQARRGDDGPRRTVSPTAAAENPPRPRSQPAADSGGTAAADSGVSVAALKNAPTGEKVPGKAGFVYSPFDEDRRLVDVEGMPSGSAVKCPYTMKVFRVP
jgi:hypothetical protein